MKLSLPRMKKIIIIIYKTNLVFVNRMPFSRTNLTQKALNISGMLTSGSLGETGSFLASFNGDVLSPLPLPLPPGRAGGALAEGAFVPLLVDKEE